MAICSCFELEMAVVGKDKCNLKLESRFLNGIIAKKKSFHKLKFENSQMMIVRAKNGFKITAYGAIEETVFRPKL